MSTEHDEDSQMLSSPDSSDVGTPKDQIADDPAALSPPPSQHRDAAFPATAATATSSQSILRSSNSSSSMPTSASGASIANSNGKRPLNTISNGPDDSEDLSIMSNTKARQEFPPQVHEPSGYTWTRSEDEPGFSWLNTKAVDEASRSWDALVHKDRMVKSRYGDIFDLIEKEKSVLASAQKQ